MSINSILRSGVRRIVLDLLGLISKPTSGIHIITAHRLAKMNDSADQFRKMLKELNKYVDFLRIEDAVQMIVRKENPSRPKVAFTFDDGFSECYTHFAPVLEEFGVNAIFFVNPNYVEGDQRYIDNFNSNSVMTPNKMPMRWNELLDLQKRGFIIGAHTMDHYMINSNNVVALVYQITECKKVIEKHTGVPCEYFAYPYGRLTHASSDAINIALDTYKYVFAQSDYKHYFSFGGRVINRRHFEPFWPVNHVKYFISCNKSY